MEKPVTPDYFPMFTNYLNLWIKSKDADCSPEEFKLAAAEVLEAASSCFVGLAGNNTRALSILGDNKYKLKTYGPFFSEKPEAGIAPKINDVKKRLKDDFGIEFSFSTHVPVDMFYQIKGAKKAGSAIIVFELGEPPTL